MYQLKTTHIYHLTAGPGSRLAFTVSTPQGFSWAEIEVSAGLWFKWDFKKKNCFYVHGTAFQHLVLCRQLNLGSQMLTAVGCRPASGPSHIGQPIAAASSPRSPRSQWREPTCNMEVTVSRPPNPEEVSPDLCHSLLVGSLSLGSDLLERREETRPWARRQCHLGPWRSQPTTASPRGPQSWLDSNKAQM